MSERIDVVVIGAGQAGLAVSHQLTGAGVEHVVLERGRVGETWRARWDSFCVVTPNWYLSLPGLPYDGDDPDGFMHRDEVVVRFERYAAGFGAPVRDGIEVISLEPSAGGGFLLQTSEGEVSARAVVVSTGAFQRLHRPPAAASLPAGLLQVDLGDYRGPGDLPDGPVLVIGSGQSGCQIADELNRSGRDVFLACGKAPWTPRRVGGRDIVWWFLETGFLDAPVDSLPSPAARLAANVQLTGAGGDRDLHYRTMQASGIELLGRFLGTEGRTAHFSADLAESVAWGDERNGQIMELVRRLVAERGLQEPEMPEPQAFDADSPERLDVSGFGAVVHTCGFRPDYASWIDAPAAFDELGFPIQKDGASTVVPGLHFAGVHFLRNRKSSSFLGAGEDAVVVAHRITTTLRGAASCLS